MCLQVSLGFLNKQIYSIIVLYEIQDIISWYHVFGSGIIGFNLSIFVVALIGVIVLIAVVKAVR